MTRRRNANRAGGNFRANFLQRSAFFRRRQIGRLKLRRAATLNGMEICGAAIRHFMRMTMRSHFS